MGDPRNLVVVADDYGIGPETSRAILELGLERRITATVLLSNSPHAERAVSNWFRAGRPIELGWHPNLTLDCPVLSAERVPSLVQSSGYFWPLGAFLRRACTGRLNPAEVAAEFRAQYQRFIDLAGRPPSFVNSHEHVCLFGPVGPVLLELLSRQNPLPYLRRVVEPFSTLLHVPGAKVKRAVLAFRGARLARRSDKIGFPGCEVLAGITDPPCVADPEFLARWLRRVPGQSVELACHPGYRDETLIGRDCVRDGASVSRRVHELHLLRSPSFPTACRVAGLRLLSPAELCHSGSKRRAA